MKTLLFLLLLAGVARAQTHCDTLEHDNRALRRVTLLQDGQLLGRGVMIDSLRHRSELSDQAVADLEKRGSAGMSALLKRSLLAEGNSATLQIELDKWRPKTWVGRVWYQASRPLAVVGGLVTTYVVFRLVL